jgi:prefoldin beta subunit
MVEVPKETKELIAQFQTYQQQLEAILIQKESLRLQTMEIEKALEELRKTEKATAYKIAGFVMVKKKVKDLEKELVEQKENLEMRVKSLEAAEKRTSEKIKELQTQLKKVMG